MMISSLKNKTLKGVAWSAAERFSVQGVQFLVLLIIARILEPKDFGLVGMLAIFIAVAQSLIDSGFSQALIRKQNRTEVDNSTVFYFNIVSSVVIYILLFVAAPWVSRFYDEPQLTSLMRLLCLVVIINSFAVVHRALYTAFLNFKIQAKASLTSAVLSGIVGIAMAFNNMGVWSLVGQQIMMALINVFLLWRYSSWRPKLIYSWKSFEELFSFGSKLLLSGLLDTVYSNIYQITIGKLFSANSLGFFTQAKTISALPSSNINGIISRVTYPVLSTIQDDDERLATNYRILLRMSAFVVIPLMCGMAGVSYPLINLLLGDKWNYTATLLIPLCFSMMWYPTHALNLNLLKVKGRPDLFLRLEIVKKVLGVTMLIVTVPFGVLAMCYGTIVNSMTALIINTYYTGKMINVGFLMQMKDLFPTLAISFSMFIVVFFLTQLFPFSCIQLSVGIIIGLLYFCFMCYIFKLEEISYIKATIKKK